MKWFDSCSRMNTRTFLAPAIFNAFSRIECFIFILIVRVLFCRRSNSRTDAKKKEAIHSPTLIPTRARRGGSNTPNEANEMVRVFLVDLCHWVKITLSIARRAHINCSMWMGCRFFSFLFSSCFCVCVRMRECRRGTSTLPYTKGRKYKHLPLIKLNLICFKLSSTLNYSYARRAQMNGRHIAASLLNVFNVHEWAHTHIQESAAKGAHSIFET